MNIEHLKDKGIDIAVVSGDEVVIADTQSVLDLAMTVKYETGAERIDSVWEGISSGGAFLLSYRKYRVTLTHESISCETE